MSTREEPERNSRMMTSRVFWSMSPCVALTVWSRCLIWSVSQSTCSSAVGIDAACKPYLIHTSKM